MQKILVIMICMFLLVGTVSAEVILNSPENSSIVFNEYQTFNISVNSSSGKTINNISLYGDFGGSWEFNKIIFSSAGILGTKSYYTLDGTSGDVEDYFGNYNGTNVGAIRGANGIIDKSFNFTGTEYVNINNVILNYTTSTFNFWINTNTTIRGTMLGNDQTGKNDDVNFELDDGTGGCAAGELLFSRQDTDNGLNYEICSDGIVNDGDWHMISGIFNTTGMFMYVDAVIQSDTDSFWEASTNQGLWVFGSNGLALLNRNYTGLLDEVGIFNVSLNHTNVQNLYNEGVGSRPISVINTTEIFTNKISCDTLWNIKACYSDDSCEFAVNNYTIIYLENNMTYDSSTYETDTSTFQINFTNSSLINNVNLVYNGTDYSTTKSGNNYSKTIDIPVYGGQNISWYWEINYDGDIANTNELNQSILSTIFTLCNATYPTPFLNISFQDEGNFSSINGAISLAEFTYYLGSGTVTKSYQYINNTENQQYGFCVSPDTETLNVDSRIQYSSTNYPQRIWNPEVTEYNSTLTEQVLYLLSTSDGIYVTFQVINSANQVISGVDVTAIREIEGTDVTVGHGTTSSDGTITFWLNPDFEHNITFVKSGFDTYSTIFAPTQSVYTITMGETTTSSPSHIRGMTSRVMPTDTSLKNDTIYLFGVQVNSTYWDMTSFGFNLRLPNGTIITGDTSAISGDILTINYDVNNQTRIYLDYFWLINSTYTNYTVAWNVYNTEYTGWSISTFFTDLTLYINSDIFGLDDFGRSLIIFFILFLTIGTLTYKYGVSSPVFLASIIFGVVFFFDVGINLIPDIALPNGNVIPNILTFIAGLILTIVIFREVVQ
ncbi:MAG: hypothetical protein J7L82_00720 [Staphylothermus sp.]|nr:hypothetical protein [Staphylothermus sp.]